MPDKTAQALNQLLGTVSALLDSDIFQMGHDGRRNLVHDLDDFVIVKVIVVAVDNTVTSQEVTQRRNKRDFEVRGEEGIRRHIRPVHVVGMRLKVVDNVPGPVGDDIRARLHPLPCLVHECFHGRGADAVAVVDLAHTDRDVVPLGALHVDEGLGSRHLGDDVLVFPVDERDEGPVDTETEGAHLREGVEGGIAVEERRLLKLDGQPWREGGRGEVTRQGNDKG